MSRRKPQRQRQLVCIEGPVEPGRLIPREPAGHFRQKASRFFNWAVDARNKPYGVPFACELPLTAFVRDLLGAGLVKLADPSEEE